MFNCHYHIYRSTWRLMIDKTGQNQQFLVEYHWK